MIGIVLKLNQAAVFQFLHCLAGTLAGNANASRDLRDRQRLVAYGCYRHPAACRDIEIR